MTLTRRAMIGAAAALPFASAAAAQQWDPHPSPYLPGRPGMPVWPPKEHFKLWPGSPPGAPAKLPLTEPSMNGDPARRELWLRHIAEPIVAVYRPAKADGRAVLSIPGGGYEFVSVQNEGIDVATRLTAQGITVFVLAYRLPGDGWAQPMDLMLQDAQRAMRLIRARAASFAIDPAKLGIVGFSAGGHLAGMLSVGFDDKVYQAVDAADTGSAKPAFSGIVYGVTGALGRPVPWYGDSDNPAIASRYQPVRRIAAGQPPLFIAHAADDGVVPVQLSLDLFAAATTANVPAELHVFQSGNHGFGALHMAETSPARLWTELFGRWIAAGLSGGFTVNAEAAPR